MSKKERLRQRRINREANVLLNKQAYGFHTAKKEEI
jgi:hypothetical protein